MKPAQRLMLVTAALLLAGCASKHIAYHYSDSQLTLKRQKQSVPLWLPRTVLEFRATCEMEITSPSPLYVEAIKKTNEQRFDLTQLEAAAKLIEVKVGTNSSKTIKLKDVTLGIKGERDPEQLFFVYLDNAWLTAVDFEAEYAPDGVIGSVSSGRQNQALEFTLKTLESTAAIAGSMLKALAHPGIIEPGKTNVAKENVPGKLAEKIKTIREHRDDLRFKSSERAGLDGAGLSRLLDDLDKEEAPLVALFKGKTEPQSTPIAITVRPKRGQVTDRIVLAEFGADGGFARGDKETGTVTCSAIPEDFLGKGDGNVGSLVLNLKARDAKEHAILDKLKKVVSSNSANGLPYQVPAQYAASVAFVDDKDVQIPLLTTDMLIGQWGVVSRLPVSMGTPGSTLKPVYYTESGALKKLTVTSTPPATDSAKSLSTAAGSITDAVKAREEANSEIGQLKKQKEKLELQVAIQKAQNELNNTNAASGISNP